MSNSRRQPRHQCAHAGSSERPTAGTAKTQRAATHLYRSVGSTQRDAADDVITRTLRSTAAAAAADAPPLLLLLLLLLLPLPERASLAPSEPPCCSATTA